jgi:hypothetical protein
MMNESNNACCVPQEAPAILSVTEENAKIIEIASIRVEDILRKLRGEKPVRPNEGCAPELPTFGALRQLTERQQRQLNRLMNSIEELDSLI